MAKDRSQIRAIFFDLDDTLCAYWDASKAGLRRAFEKDGPEGHSPEEMVRHWAAAFREFSPTLKHTDWYRGYCESGEPTRTEQMRLTLARVGIDDPSLAVRLSESYRQERDAALALFPEALSVLQNLKERFPLGLVTNGPADIQRQEIETLGIGEFFDPILIEGEMGEGKPLPAVFRRAAEAAGCEPSELLFVGNSYGHDVRPALDAGWHAIWVRRESDIPPSADGTRAAHESMPAGAPPPDAIVSDLNQVVEFLDEVGSRPLAHSAKAR